MKNLKKIHQESNPRLVAQYLNQVRHRIHQANGTAQELQDKHNLGVRIISF
jgi:hypothetical protein